MGLYKMTDPAFNAGGTIQWSFGTSWAGVCCSYTPETVGHIRAQHKLNGKTTSLKHWIRTYHCETKSGSFLALGGRRAEVLVPDFEFRNGYMAMLRYLNVPLCWFPNLSTYNNNLEDCSDKLSTMPIIIRVPSFRMPALRCRTRSCIPVTDR